jgi:hypothetical protein
MHHAFNIYPALLVLTPVAQLEPLGKTNSFEEREGSSATERHFTTCPQTYWGNCLYNENHTQLMFGFRKDPQACPVHEQIDGRLNVLEPTKFKGKHYTITYIPVLN